MHVKRRKLHLINFLLNLCITEYSVQNEFMTGYKTQQNWFFHNDLFCKSINNRMAILCTNIWYYTLRYFWIEDSFWSKKQIYIQCLTTIPGRLLNSLWKWGHFDRAKPTLKLLLASWTFHSFLKRFRSFNAENLGSVDQRAAKWPAIKLWEWFDPSTTRIRADWFERGRGRLADFFLWPPTLTAGNFEAL